MTAGECQKILNHLPLPAFILQNGILRAVNPEMARITGYTAGELAGRPLAGLVHPEDLPGVVAACCLTDERVPGLKWRAVARGGEVVHLQGFHSCFEYNGRPALLGLVLDITAREKEQEEMKSREFRYRTILDNIEDGYFEVDLAGNMTYFNNALLSILGYRGDELIGMNYREFTNPSDAEMIFKAFNRVYLTGQPTKVFNHVVVTRDGSRRWVENSISLVRDSESRRSGFRGIVRDVTEHKLKGEELDLQKAYFQQLFENSPEGIAILDNEDMLIEVNRGFEKLFQYTTDEIRGRPVNEVIIPDHMLNQASALSKRALSGEIVQVETLRKRRDGRLVDVSILAYPVIYGQKQFGIYVMYSDITDRKRAQADLQAMYERLEAANQELEAANEELIAAEEELKQQYEELQRSEQALRESEKKFRLLFHKANDGIVLVVVRQNRGFGRFIEVNEVTCRRLGYSREEFLALGPLDIVVPEDHDIVQGLTQEFLDRGSITFEVTCLSKNGQKIPFEISGHIFTLNGGKVALFVVRDITDRKLAEEKLRTAHQQLVDIIEFLPDATFAVDREKKVIAWNRAIEEMTGVRKEQIMGLGDYAYAVPFYGVPRPALLELLFSKDSGVDLLYDHIERKGNTLFTEVFVPSLFEGKGAYIWVKASPLYDSNGNMVGAIESIRDITERKQFEQQLKFLSLHDPLTGLYNRAYFEEEMRRLEGGRFSPISIIICDIDGLKLVNDTLGHHTGDDFLVAAAGVIKDSFRGGDMIARIGGDEFAILLPKSDREAVEAACSRIREAISRYNRAHPDLPLSMSIGFATGGEGSAPADLFKEADNNMYREKLHRSQSARSAIVQTLMKALEARDFITEGHADRLQDLVITLGRDIGLPERSITDLRLLAQFHDIGKVGISDRILFKPGPLTGEETAEMRRHCEIGHRIAQAAPDMAHISDWILKHHEWWNGKGYPIGLKGEEIPLECRILAIIDAYDAMTSDRPYRKAMSRGEAAAELKRCSGKQFDPELVSAFLKVLKKNKNLPLGGVGC